MSGRLLLDEMFHPSIAARLVERGHDCRSVVADPALRRQRDRHHRGHEYECAPGGVHDADVAQWMAKDPGRDCEQ